MSKKEIPKIVTEVLKEVPETIKGFNSKSDFKLVVKSSDDFLLKIYPKNHEFIFFQINRYTIDDICKPLDNAISKYFYPINSKSIK